MLTKEEKDELLDLLKRLESMKSNNIVPKELWIKKSKAFCLHVMMTVYAVFC